MIDKQLVKQRFSKSLKTYNDNAFVQKRMAERLISMLPAGEYNSILEIGAGTGILTEKAVRNIKFKEYSCIDLAEEAEEYIKRIIPESSFTAGDIEAMPIKGRYDLIISNAALQWCADIEKTVKKLLCALNKKGVLAFSIFGNSSLKELREVLNLENMLQTNIKGIEETETLYFDSPLEVLKHIKSTGANALGSFRFTKASLKEFERKYREKALPSGRIPLTYKPLYCVTSI